MPARPLTVPECAQRLNLSPRRVRELIAEGKIRAEQVQARLYLVQPGELTRYRRRLVAPGPGKRGAPAKNLMREGKNTV